MIGELREYYKSAPHASHRTRNARALDKHHSLVDEMKVWLMSDTVRPTSRLTPMSVFKLEMDSNKNCSLISSTKRTVGGVDEGLAGARHCEADAQIDADNGRHAGTRCH